MHVEGNKIPYKDSIDSYPSIVSFFQKHMFPPVMRVTGSNWDFVSSMRARTALIILPGNEPDHPLLEMAKGLAEKYKRNYRFAWLDGKEYNHVYFKFYAYIQFITHFSLYSGDLPTLIVVDVALGVHYREYGMQNTEADWESLIIKINKGELEPIGPGSSIYSQVKFVYYQLYSYSIVWLIILDLSQNNPVMSLIYMITFGILIVAISLLICTDPPERKLKQD